jgi:uncharacterized protein YbjT (DUF2867 family)
MNYVITGSLGHISQPLSKKLLAAGHKVTIISSNESRKKEIEKLGATAAIGSVEDVAFLSKAFFGADAVYTMVPPFFGAANWKEWIGQVGKNYAEAIKANKINYVVNLSSFGAHLPDGCGPVSGLHKAEAALNALTDVNILHLRASYFFDNLFSNINLVKNLNFMGSNFGGPGFKLVLSDPLDIADTAFEELSVLRFKGHAVRYVASDERNTDEIAAVLGTAVGKPGLNWVVFTDEQAKEGMVQAGLPVEVARNYAEMGAALQSGKMAEDYWQHHPEQLGRLKLEDFAFRFAGAYNAN